MHQAPDARYQRLRDRMLICPCGDCAGRTYDDGWVGWITELGG